MIIEVDSKVTFGNNMHNWHEIAVKNEPMLFNCDLPTATSIGGGITLNFLEELPESWKNGPLVIDSRTHMLMPGWHTCIPGWHHDDVPRTRSDGQPNYEPGQIRSEHIMALVGADICPTEFAIGDARFEVPPTGKVVYERWHDAVETLADVGKLESVYAPMNQLIHFDDRTWHRGTAATGNGWRFFIRASRHFDADGNRVARPGKLANEQRKQAQVYLPALNAGW